ncbi:MAG TPA: amidohydrolase family protein [Terriglobia bacterium]|nr:amidohydrolase family protein [Terriglobia bacterium]
MITPAACRNLLLLLLMPIWAVAEKPQTDYHEHLLSPVVARILGQPKPFLARDLIAELDAAGIRRAVVLSLAYQFGKPNRPRLRDEYTQVKRENDWTANQVKEYSGRLVGFCGVNPLREYALAEIDRCSHNPYLSAGLKLHFGNSDVDLDNPMHVRKVREVFHAADSHRMAIVVHLHPNLDHHRPYGAGEAQTFIREVLSAAPHVIVQVAHLAGSGGYDDPATDAALSVFVNAISHHDPRVSHLYFDVSGVAGLGDWKNKKQLIASRIREVGIRRVLFGSDGAWTSFTPLRAEEDFRELPLTGEEFRVIDTNVLSYMPEP